MGFSDSYGSYYQRRVVFLNETLFPISTLGGGPLKAPVIFKFYIFHNYFDFGTKHYENFDF